MRTIWKFELAVTDVQRVDMPAGAEILSVQGQQVEEWRPGIAMGMRQALMLWARVDPDAPGVERLIAVVGTGNPAPGPDDGATYIGTAICGPMVWHVFDGGEHWPASARSSSSMQPMRDPYEEAADRRG